MIFLFFIWGKRLVVYYFYLAFLVMIFCKLLERRRKSVEFSLGLVVWGTFVYVGELGKRVVKDI